MAECWLYTNSNSGTGNGTIGLTFDKNITGADKTATVVVTTTDGKISKECDVTQGFDNVTIYKTSKKICVTKTKDAAECLANECPSDVTVCIEKEDIRFISLVSVADAEQQATNYLEANAQRIANEQGSCDVCLWYNREITITLQKECAEGYTGSICPYIISAGLYTSDISQQDADDKAKAGETAKAQAAINASEDCTCVPDNEWHGVATDTGARSDCSENYKATTVTITQADLTVLCATADPVHNIDAYPFVSYVSQADANEKAETALAYHKETLLKQKSECVENQKYEGSASGMFTKHNCNDGGTGSEENISTNMCSETAYASSSMCADYPFLAYTQAEADALAEAALNAHGQEVADMKGTCTWLGEYSKVFTKDCGEGVDNVTLTVTQAMVKNGDGQLGVFTSTESKAAADALAKAAVEAQGQALVDAKTCGEKPKYAANLEWTFTKDDCEDCKHGKPFTVMVTMDMVGSDVFYSEISEEDANAQVAAFYAAMSTADPTKTNEQMYANKNGLCEADAADFEKDEGVAVCIGGISKIKYENVNACYTKEDDQVRYEAGTAHCTCVGEAQHYFKVCVGSNNEGSYTVDQTMVTGYPVSVTNICGFDENGKSIEVEQSSCDCQTRANALAEAAVLAQGQDIADAAITCRVAANVTFTFINPTCGECEITDYGTLVAPTTVTLAMVGNDESVFYAATEAEANAQVLAWLNSMSTETTCQTNGYTNAQCWAQKNLGCKTDASKLEAMYDESKTKSECDGCSLVTSKYQTNACATDGKGGLIGVGYIVMDTQTNNSQCVADKWVDSGQRTCKDNTCSQYTVEKNTCTNATREGTLVGNNVAACGQTDGGTTQCIGGTQYMIYKNTCSGAEVTRTALPDEWTYDGDPYCNHGSTKYQGYRNQCGGTKTEVITTSTYSRNGSYQCNGCDYGYLRTTYNACDEEIDTTWVTTSANSSSCVEWSSCSSSTVKSQSCSGTTLVTVYSGTQYNNCGGSRSCESTQTSANSSQCKCTTVTATKNNCSSCSDPNWTFSGSALSSATASATWGSSMAGCDYTSQSSAQSAAQSAANTLSCLDYCNKTSACKELTSKQSAVSEYSRPCSIPCGSDWEGTVTKSAGGVATLTCNTCTDTDCTQSSLDIRAQAAATENAYANAMDAVEDAGCDSACSKKVTTGTLIVTYEVTGPACVEGTPSGTTKGGITNPKGQHESISWAGTASSTYSYQGEYELSPGTYSASIDITNTCTINNQSQTFSFGDSGSATVVAGQTSYLTLHVYRNM